MVINIDTLYQLLQNVYSLLVIAAVHFSAKVLVSDFLNSHLNTGNAPVLSGVPGHGSYLSP